MISGCQGPSPKATQSAPQSIDNVAARTMTLRDFRLKSGVVMPEVVIAYETYGKLDPSGRNAVLIAHGNTSSFHAAGRYAHNQAALNVNERDLGWWDGIIGPGKAFDTDRYFVVSSNVLGGSFGSSGPRLTNPATGRPWGPDFPAVTLEDMVAAQKALLDGLGVKHLVAVAGPSYGGFITFQWGISYPDTMDGLVPVVTSPTGPKKASNIENMAARLAKDANWNGGWYYDRGGIAATLTEMHMARLKAYGLDEELAATIPDPAAREAEIRKRSEPWGRSFDGNSLLVQRKAMEFRDHAKDFGRIKAKVLYVLASTDKLFPPSIAPKVMADLKAAGVDATYFQIETAAGHSGGTRDAYKMDAALRDFLARLR